MAKLHIGISACLLGEKVRFDGSHKRNRWLCETLSDYVHFVPFCPEVGIGLSTPRPTLRLIELADSDVRLVDSKTLTADYTDQTQQFGQDNQGNLDNLDGYILMQGSPSCGMERVRVYNEAGMPEKKGTGIFAAYLKEKNPSLPIEEAGRLEDPLIAESFLTRLFVYHEWRTEKPFESAKALIQFHSKHKFLLLMHSTEAYKQCGKLLSNLSGEVSLTDIAKEYINILMTGLSKVTKTGQRTNTLLHLFSYVKNLISDTEKQSVLKHIEHYHKGLLPYAVPLNLLKHIVTQYEDQAKYINNQSIWQPYPQSLVKVHI